MRLIFEERIKNECFNDYKYYSVAVDWTDLLLASIKKRTINHIRYLQF